MRTTLCVSAILALGACAGDPVVTADAAAAIDAPAVTDLAPVIDAPLVIDAATPIDAPAVTDVATPIDAPALTDAPTVTDAPAVTDAPPPMDVPRDVDLNPLGLTAGVAVTRALGPLARPGAVDLRTNAADIDTRIDLATQTYARVQFDLRGAGRAGAST
jgi:hypothetical protein